MFSSLKKNQTLHISWKSLFHLPVLKDVFTRYRIQGWQVFSFDPLKLLHCLLALCLRNWLSCLSLSRCLWYVFFSDCFKIFFSPLVLSNLIWHTLDNFSSSFLCLQFVELLGSTSFTLYIKFKTFSAIISSKFFCPPILLHCSYKHTEPLKVFPQLIYAVYFFPVFFLCAFF